MKKAVREYHERYTAKYAVFFDGLYIEELYEGDDLDKAIEVADWCNNVSEKGCCFVINGKCLDLRAHHKINHKKGA